MTRLDPDPPASVNYLRSGSGSGSVNQDSKEICMDPQLVFIFHIIGYGTVLTLKPAAEINNCAMSIRLLSMQSTYVSM